MPTDAASYAKGQVVKGPAGTASQRATKSGTIKGRQTTAGAAVKGKGAGSTKQGTRKSGKRSY
jgi:hypothetical protein